MLTGYPSHRGSAETVTEPRGVDEPASTNRISSLQFGPCWCRGLSGRNDSFDFMRLRTTTAQLPIEHNLFIISARIVGGAQPTVLQVFDQVPAPKLVVRSGVCRSTSQFWDDLPPGWVASDELIPVDIEIEECISGMPEALLVAVMTHVADQAEVVDRNAHVAHGG